MGRLAAAIGGGLLAVLAALAILAVLAGCGGSAGLGRHACPYLRPRLARIDADRARTPPDLTDLRAVANDIAIYVTQLPDGGKGSADRPLVTFSRALNRFVVEGGRGGADVDAAEAAVRRECRVGGY